MACARVGRSGPRGESWKAKGKESHRDSQVSTEMDNAEVPRPHEIAAAVDHAYC